MSEVSLEEHPLHLSTALTATGSIRATRVLAMILLCGFLSALFALWLTPWQQSVRGTGRVIAYAPLERQQIIEAPILGRVVHWYVQEGQQVKEGEIIAQLADNDPEILTRLERQRVAIASQIDAIHLAILMTEERINSLTTARDFSISQAKLRADMAKDRQRAAANLVNGSEAAFKTAQLNLRRQTELHKQGLASTRDLELAQLNYETTKADLDRAKASLKAAVSEVKALLADRESIAANTQASIDAARTSLADQKAKQREIEAKLAQNEVGLARQQQMQVIAPRAGTILRLLANQGTEMVKAGDPLVILVPDTASRAVELWVDGNDVPLITPGRHVRLQFEGWPAIQFVGWPSVAVGTFAGEVAFVDATDDGTGKFRIVVSPTADEPWPEHRYLRQGVRAKGWVLLNQVSLGFELWRQFNGFPPALPAPADTSGGDKK